MTRHGGGSFGGPGGGGGGGGFGPGGGGRSTGGSFGPPPPRHHPPTSCPPPPPHHRRHLPPIIPTPVYVGPSPVIYSSGPRVGTPGYQMPPPEVRARVDRRTELVNWSKAILTFIFIALLIGTFWMYAGPYGSTVVEIGEHDSRLITARPYFIDSIKFKNRYETEGPSLYVFDHKPPLNQESSWHYTEDVLFHNYHLEWYYWLNQGSTVTVDYTMVVKEKLKSVYLAMIRNNPEDLQEYYEKPGAVAKPLSGHGTLSYEAHADGDYALSLITYNPSNVSVYLDFHFNSRQYSTASALDQGSLTTSGKINLSFFRSRYGLLVGPGSNKTGIVEWEIEVSYGTRWTTIIFIYGLVILIYLVTKSMIMASVHELDPSLPEYAPLVQSQEATAPAPLPTQASGLAPSAPLITSSIAKEVTADLKKQEMDIDIAEDKLCSVCLDAPKDSFFVPCGHRATCYTCGLRISKSHHANCPICRQPIGELKRIYDA